jgi:hypothetical protein
LLLSVAIGQDFPPSNSAPGLHGSGGFDAVVQPRHGPFCPLEMNDVTIGDQELRLPLAR